MALYVARAAANGSLLSKFGRQALCASLRYSSTGPDDKLPEKEKVPERELKYIPKGPLYDNRPDDVMERLKPFYSRVFPYNKEPNQHIPFHVVTMDDPGMPRPEGDWYEDHRVRNRRYWLDLIFGLTWLSLPFIYMFVYEPVFWNFGPPPMLPKEERYKTFWEPPEDDE